MLCDLSDGVCINCGGITHGALCAAECHLDELLAMQRGDVAQRAVLVTAVQQIALSAATWDSLLTLEELASIAGTDRGSQEEPELLGSRIKRLFSAIGIPPCRGCAARAEWLDRAHRAWRTLFS